MWLGNSLRRLSHQAGVTPSTKTVASLQLLLLPSEVNQKEVDAAEGMTPRACCELKGLVFLSVILTLS